MRLKVAENHWSYRLIRDQSENIVVTHTGSMRGSVVIGFLIYRGRETTQEERSIFQTIKKDSFESQYANNSTSFDYELYALPSPLEPYVPLQSLQPNEKRTRVLYKAASVSNPLSCLNSGRILQYQLSK